MTGIATAKISADGTSIVNAIIMAPKTMKGERRNSRSTMLTPDCTWFTSLVIRVISVSAPKRSSCEKLSSCTLVNNRCLSSPPSRIAAFAAKYCAVIENPSPAAPSSKSKADCCNT